MNNRELEEFYKRYYNEIKVYAFTLVRNWAVAEDIACDTFLKASRLLLDGEKPVRYWLLKVARNLCFDMLKKQKKRAELSENIAEDDGLDQIILDEEYAALYRALDLLDQRPREVVTLFYFEEMSLKDISGLTELSEANVKVILFRARRDLKKLLQGEI